MTDTTHLITTTADIVAAYVTKNAVQAGDLPALIASVFKSLTDLASPPPAVEDKPVPPVSIRKSVTPDYLISLEDGKQYKSLKRHLSSRGLTPEEYRTKWGLPLDYPMVAATYAATRSELAKSIGLGQKGRGNPAATPAPAPTKTRGRPKAA